MKQSEFKNCAICNKGIMHAGNVVFYRIALESFCVDLSAVRRRAGLEQMLGSSVLAGVMGPDEDIAKSLTRNPMVALICLGCFLEPDILPRLTEKLMALTSEDESEKKGTL